MAERPDQADVTVKRSGRTELREVACETCGHRMPIQRRRSKLRSTGHVKHMYCPTCEKITAHTESKD